MHGTGTVVGDRKEAHAVSSVFCQDRDETNPMVVGSVKTSIGHLEGAAGVAGLIKAVLAVEKGYIPKHLNFEKANPDIDLEQLKLKVSVLTQCHNAKNQGSSFANTALGPTGDDAMACRGSSTSQC